MKWFHPKHIFLGGIVLIAAFMFIRFFIATEPAISPTQNPNKVNINGQEIEFGTLQPMQSTAPQSNELQTEIQQIDQWIKENNLNEYGDPQDTMYTGGTPLFNEQTGETIDKYDYIRQKHPDKPWLKSKPIQGYPVR